jgi:nucleotide-binding universal stress UspA family protein
MYRKILVPLDGSEFAEKVLPHVETLASCTGAAVVLLRVTVYTYEGVSAAADMAGFMPVTLPETREEIRKEAADYLNKVGEGLRTRGLQVSTVVREGNAGEVIAELAHGEGVDLIAMSTHGRTGLGRALFGSVAEQVLRQAGKPLLLLRP